MGRLKYLGVLVVLALLLTACAISAELPTAGATTPLVEYSDNEGGTWHGLIKNEVKRLDATTVQIRKTREGTALRITASSDRGRHFFSGCIRRVDDTIVIEGGGGVIILAGTGGRDYYYAKIILE